MVTSRSVVHAERSAWVLASQTVVAAEGVTTETAENKGQEFFFVFSPTIANPIEPQESKWSRKQD